MILINGDTPHRFPEPNPAGTINYHIATNTFVIRMSNFPIREARKLDVQHRTLRLYRPVVCMGSTESRLSLRTRGMQIIISECLRVLI